MSKYYLKKREEKKSNTHTTQTKNKQIIEHDINGLQSEKQSFVIYPLAANVSTALMWSLETVVMYLPCMK